MPNTSGGINAKIMQIKRILWPTFSANFFCFEEDVIRVPNVCDTNNSFVTIPTLLFFSPFFAPTQIKQNFDKNGNIY